MNEYNFPAEKVMVLRQGILEDIELIQKNKAKEQLGLKGNIYLVIGSLVPDHGADTVIKQAKQIDGTIVIAASDKAINDRNDTRQIDWLNHLKGIVEKNEITNVRFDIKELPYKLWWKYFAAADIVLLPYKGGIGSGIFADCVATKKPMVASDIKYFREFAKDWEFVQLASTEFDWGKAISRMNIGSDIDSDFNEYIKQNGMTALAKKYKEIYKWEK